MNYDTYVRDVAARECEERYERQARTDEISSRRMFEVVDRIEIRRLVLEVWGEGP